MSNYNFDKIIDRTNTRSEKWDETDKIFQKQNLLPLWVADMDFPCAPPIIDTIIKRANHGFFGYSYMPAEYYMSIINWFEQKHRWKIEKDWIFFTPGVIPGINFSIQAFSEPRDKIIIQNPAYPPFYMAVKNNNRRKLLNPLKLSNGKYEMDFNDLKRKISDPKAKMLILCSPHNPSGRVWTKDELLTLGELCLENQVLVLSDEIHCDLTYEGIIHVPFASISDDFAQNSIICTSPSKTFNLPGIKVSNIVIPNPTLQKRFNKVRQQNGITEPHCFASLVLEAAYNESEDWLNAVLKYIKKNLEFLKDYVRENMQRVEVIEPQGTYLVWLDFRNFGLTPKELTDVIFDKARVALFEGWLFGKGGHGFERINIACPRHILEEALNRISRALKSI